MREELLYILEENNKDEIAKIIKNESICEEIEENEMKLHIIRMKKTGSFGVFLSKNEGVFNENELKVIERYLSNIGRSIDVIGEERVGVILDKHKDIKPFNNMDLIFPYKKTYKTQSYARMIGYSILNEVKEFNNAKPNKEIAVYKYI